MRALLLCAALCLGAASARSIHDGRSRREIEMHDWLTAEQKSELEELKKGGNLDEMKKKIMALYAELPSEKKEEWDEKYKKMCIAWLKDVASEEELEELKKLKETGENAELRKKYDSMKGRLNAEGRKMVDLWDTECRELWKDEVKNPARLRRAIDDLVEKHLTFLTDAQRAELKQMKQDGKTDVEVKDKVLEWSWELLKKEGKVKSIDDFVTDCYKWIKDVTTPEEYAAFEKLHHTDHEACRKKVREFLARLPLDRQQTVNGRLPLCDALWYKQHEQHAGHDHSAHHHKRHTKRHLNSLHIEQYLHWLTPEQKAEIQKIEDANESYDVVVEKVKEFYKALGEGRQTEVREDFKTRCGSWVKTVASEAEVEELKEAAENGNHEQIKALLKTQYEKLNEEAKHEVDHIQDLCIVAWTTKHRGRRDKAHEHTMDEIMTKFLSWMSEEEKAEVLALNGEDKTALVSKVIETFERADGEKKEKATEQLKHGCRHFIKHLIGDERAAEMKKLHEAKASSKQMAERLDEIIATLTDEAVKSKAQKLAANCRKIYGVERKRRDHHEGHDHHKELTSWLSEDEAKEVLALKEDKEKMYGKIMEFWAKAEGEKKAQATEKLQCACRHHFKELFGEEKAEELKKLKESGTSVEEIAKKVAAYVEEITDEKKKDSAKKAVGACKKIFGVADARKRRDHHEGHDHHKELTSWLSEDEAKEVLALKEDKEKMYGKIMEFWAKAEGEKKVQATEKLQCACRHHFKELFGAEKAEELKKLKESGTSVEEIAKKVAAYVEEITDEKKKDSAKKAVGACKKIFGVADARKRRDHHEGHDEHKELVSWLTETEAKEVLALKDDTGKMYGKIMELWEKAEGDKKTQATEKLKGECKRHFTELLGEEKAGEIKKLKETGASLEEVHKKVEAFIEQVQDAHKKEHAQKAVGACKKIFEAAEKSRKRRDHHIHTADEIVEKFLPWMSEAEKAEVKTLYGEDKSKLPEKILEIYGKTDGDKKTEATEKLKHGCRHFIKQFIGEEKAGEVKKLHDAGAQPQEIAKKIDEAIEGLADEAQKAKAKKVTETCKKIYGVSRRRRDHHTEEFLTSWLNPEQKAEVKDLLNKDDKDKLYSKIAEFYEKSEGDTKKEAAEKLRQGCRHYFKSVFGEDKANEIKKLKEGGASFDEIAKKVDALIDGLADADKKARASKAIAGCKKVFNASRKRRDHHEGHPYKEYFEWLTAEQKEEVKSLREKGDKEGIYKKIVEFWTATEGEAKNVATEKLKGACKAYAAKTFGEEKVAEVKKLREGGASHEDLVKKFEEFVAALPDDQTKKEADAVVKGCAKVYMTSSRTRRDEPKLSLEAAFKDFLPWLSEEQKMEIKNMDESGAGDKIHEKVLEYFEELEGDAKKEAREKLKGACRHFINKFIGPEKTAEVKKLAESGAAHADVGKEVDKIIAGIADAETKGKAEKVSASCKKIYEVAGRRRRDKDEKSEKFKEFFTWLTEEQRAVVKDLKAKDDFDALGKKIHEFYDAVPADKKAEATEKMKGACRQVLRDQLGDEKADEIKKLKESGTPVQDLIKNVESAVDALAEGKQKELAKKSLGGCARFFASSRVRRDKDEKYKEYFTWLTEEQRAVVKELKAKDDIEGLGKKISEFYNAVAADKKGEVTEKLKGACRQTLRDQLGDEKADEIKKLKESGTPLQDLIKTVETAVDAITDEKKKKIAKESLGGCAPFFTASRLRRENSGKYKEYTKWLTEEQRTEIKALKEKDDEEALIKKINEFYEAVPADKKSEATEQLRGACRQRLRDLLGDEKADELKKLKESGTDVQELVKKVETAVDALPDGKEKDSAKRSLGGCARFFVEK